MLAGVGAAAMGGDRGITYYADPGCRQAGQVYAGENGRRGTYFRDPNGHLMEILTSNMISS